MWNKGYPNQSSKKRNFWHNRVRKDFKWPYQRLYKRSIYLRESLKQDDKTWLPWKSWKVTKSNPRPFEKPNQQSPLNRSYFSKGSEHPFVIMGYGFYRESVGGSQPQNKGKHYQLEYTVETDPTPRVIKEVCGQTYNDTST